MSLELMPWQFEGFRAWTLMSRNPARGSCCLASNMGDGGLDVIREDRRGIYRDYGL